MSDRESRFLGLISSGHVARWDSRPGISLQLFLETRAGAEPVIRFVGAKYRIPFQFFLTIGRVRNLVAVLQRALATFDEPGPIEEVDNADEPSVETVEPARGIHLHVHHHHGAPRRPGTPRGVVAPIPPRTR